MSEPEGIACAPNIVDAGLPHRSEQLLERESRSYPGMVDHLFLTGKGEAPRMPVLTTAVLHRALESKEPTFPYTAAFLIGRCRAEEARAETRLTEHLEKRLATPGASDVRIEAGMSLVLRGHLEQGREALLRALRSPEPLGDQYKAAFYLAQLGDDSGFPAMKTTLEGALSHYRLMAMRHLLAFAPYDGQRVAGQRIDIRQLLVDRLQDSDALVRREVPFYLEELGVPDLKSLLEAVARSDPDQDVRTAAQLVLSRASR